MENSVYAINKGINKSIEFKGLKAQYIWWLGGGLVGLLALFAVLYIIGINSYVCVGFILIAGTAVVSYVYRLSNRYGEHGMMKKMARRSIPPVITSRGRKVFIVPSPNAKKH
jgi:hypothetical protein